MAGKVVRVLVIERDRLLGATIEALLQHRNGIEVIGISPFAETNLIKTIYHLQPDIVILSEDTFLTKPGRLLALLEDFPKFTIVVVSANENDIQLFQKDQKSISKIADFLSTLQSQL